MTIQKPITLQEAKSIARHLGLTLRKARSGHYRVNFRDGDESTACYAVDLEDAVNSPVMKSISDQSESGATTMTSMASSPSISAIMTMANAISI